MSDFYTVLRRSIDRADAPDDEQRQEIYDRLRAVIVRKLDAHRPRLKDTEFRSRLVAFDGRVLERTYVPGAPLYESPPGPRYFANALRLLRFNPEGEA